MKKVTVLTLDTDRDRTLDRLRAMGVLHVVPVTPPSGPDLEQARLRCAEAETAVNILRTVERRPLRRQDSWVQEASRLAAEEVVARTVRLQKLRRELEERRATLRKESDEARAFGDVDAAQIQAMAAAGLTVRVFRIVGKHIPPAPEGACLRVIQRDSTGADVALASLGPCTYPGVERVPPARRWNEVEKDLQEVEAALGREEERLGALATRVSSVENFVSGLRAQVRYVEAKAGMGTAGLVVYLQGFCPEEAVDALRNEARRVGWGLIVEDPSPSDRVPTLIRNPRWIRPVESLFRMIRILPGYRETDVSAAFLFFMSLFFAMIIGDVGYGLIFLGITWAARRRFRRAPREPFQLLMIFSGATIVWGAACGTYFGMTPSRWPRIAWLGDYRNLMHLCLWLGAIHLSVAHLWNAVRWANSLRALAQLGWTALTWTMFFAARAFLLRQPFPRAYVPAAVGGLLLVVLFMTPWAKLRTEWASHVMLPLTLMSNFGDVLSYLRLFALSVAGLQLALAFNTMARGIGWGDPMRGVLAAVILLVGHAMNVGLGALSVLVHGVRLNALEFSMHFGLEWSGLPYEPLALTGGGGDYPADGALAGRTAG